MTIGIDIRMIGRQRTGDETVFFNLVKNLALIDGENKYKLFTDITDANIIGNIKNRLEIPDKPNFSIISLPTKNKFTWNIWTLPAYLRNHPLDVYHTQYITPFFVPKKIKIVTHIHDVSFLAYPEFIKMSDLLFLKTLIPLSLRRADAIVAVSEFTKKEIMKHYGIASEKIIVAYNGIGDDYQQPLELSPERKEELRAKYHLPEKYILYVGTLQPRKNIPLFLSAYFQIKAQLGDIKVVLVGNRKAHNADPRIDAAIEARKLAGSIVFPGFVDQEDLPSLYRMAHAFVFPSLYEGFGIPLLEAMSREIPVLASDIPVHREVAGEAAMFADPSSLDQFSQSLYDISINESMRRKLVEAGSARPSLFSWRKTAETIRDIYSLITSE